MSIFSIFLKKVHSEEEPDINVNVTVEDIDVTLYFTSDRKFSKSFETFAFYCPNLSTRADGISFQDASERLENWMSRWAHKDGFVVLGTSIVLFSDFLGADIRRYPQIATVKAKVNKYLL